MRRRGYSMSSFETARSCILMIDDDIGLTELVREELAGYGFQLDAVHSGEDGLARLRQGKYALVILDVMLPGRNGFEVLSHLRQFSAVPVLMLTARGEPMDVALGFRMGSDDYMAKPFGSEELALRIQAILRRAQPHSARLMTENADGRADDIELMASSHRVFRDGVEVHLTSAEFEILSRFLQTPGEIVSREELCRISLGRELNVLDRSVDNLVASLRKKLSYGNRGEPKIKSARGRGYFYAST